MKQKGQRGHADAAGQKDHLPDIAMNGKPPAEGAKDGQGSARFHPGKKRGPPTRDTTEQT
jgi:hypothetical protein